MKLKLACTAKQPLLMSFESCCDSLRKKLDEAHEHQRSAAQLLEHCANVLLANLESRGVAHLEDLLEIVDRTSLAATVAALKARGGYLSMRIDALRVLHAHEQQQRISS